MQRLIYDQKMVSKENNYLPFGLTDIFTESVHSNDIEILHFWQLENTFILGMKDTRTPFLKNGLKNITSPYTPIVRNSGGLGVIVDAGILNISLIFPKTNELSSTDDAYEKMWHITQKAFPELTIEAYEITDSYCPGTYDLSVNGRKIAGIAQRRVKEGIAVMMYLSVNGNQMARGQIVADFYRNSLYPNHPDTSYPTVNPESMVNLDELLGMTLTVDQVKQRFSDLFIADQTIDDLDAWVSENAFDEQLQRKLASMTKRNQIIQEAD